MGDVKNVLKVRTCHSCKTRYMPVTKAQKYCSDACRYEAKAAKARKVTQIKSARRVANSKMNRFTRGQNKAYILLIQDGVVEVAIKFGVTKDFALRLGRIRSLSCYTVSCLGVWEFNSGKSCRDAEFACTRELACGVVLKRDMKDGYTETTSVLNLDHVIRIYEHHGGVRIE